MRLDGRVAVITGAASGIGLATARRLVAEGMRVAACDIDEPGLDRLVAELGSGVLLARRADVGVAAEVAAFAAAVHERVRAVDVVVCNAGIGQAGGLVHTPLDVWERVMRVNVLGAVHTCHAFVPAMIHRGEGGQIVTMASALGYFAVPGLIGYSTSKYALLGFSESLRAELHAHGIGVTAVCPGLVRTGIVASTTIPGSRGARIRERLDRLYAERGWPPERVAAAVVKAIRTNPPLLPVTPEAWAILALRRFAPETLQPIGRFLAKKLAGRENIAATDQEAVGQG